MHDHIEVATNLTGREVHTYNVQVRLNVRLINPTKIKRLIPLYIRKRRTYRINIIQLTVFACNQIINTYLRVLIRIAIINRKDNTRTRIAIQIIRCIRIIRKRQYTVLWPEVNKARTIRL